jgi:hypothetical protein
MTVQNNIDFMDGTLDVVFMPENNITLGTLNVFIDDELKQFNAQAVCLEGDVYSEKVGMDIVKLKLQRKYYLYKKSIVNRKRNRLLEQLKALDSTDYDKKLSGVENRLNFHLKDVLQS